MKQIDELIENAPSIKIGLDDFYGKQTVKNIIETLKAELKEQYKKDVIEAYRNGEANCTMYISCGKNVTAEQYYKENH